MHQNMVEEMTVIEKPTVKVNDWIVVGKIDCLVSKIYDKSYPFGSCEVVCNPHKPTNHDVRWNGKAWAFKETGDYGGYADRNPELSEFVLRLKKGKHA